MRFQTGQRVCRYGEVGHFLNDGLHVIKDNMLPVPPLFRLIQVGLYNL